jgi:hypothetical protein
MGNSPVVTNSLISVKEVAASLEVQPAAVYRWTYSKHPLPVRRNGRRVFIHIDDLVDFLHAKMEKSLMPTPKPEVEKEWPTSDQAALPPSPVATATSDLLQHPTFGNGQRELGSHPGTEVPRIAMLIGLQYM